MTHKIYCVTSALSLGCTFLDWSLLYLSGQQKFFNVRKSSFVPVSNDPLMFDKSISNAHGHKKNHPSGKIQTIDYASQLKAKSNGSDLFSMYPFPLYVDSCCHDLGIDTANLDQSDKLKIVTEYQKQDYLDTIKITATKFEIPVVYVWHDHRSQWCQWQFRAADRKFISAEIPTSAQDLLQEQQDIFFKISQVTWNNLRLTESWDVRERMALDIRPFDRHWSQNLIDPVGIEFSVDCQDLWSDTESVITDVMSRLGIIVRLNMIDHWRLVMKKWQTMQQENMEFSVRLPRILDAIINNKDYLLPDLSLYQEAIVQHCLIYQHNLNFKTWGLCKFPANAQDLHRLLEPNIHCINA